MEKNEGSRDRLSMRAVTAYTGLSEHTLRAWERRYRAVVPERTKGGTRTYSDADVERVMLLLTGVKEGHPIRELTRLSNDELRAQIPACRSLVAGAVEELVGFLMHSDLVPLSDQLRELFHLLGPRRFAYAIAQPFLQRVGELWHAQLVTVAQEHFASGFVRSLLEAWMQECEFDLDRPAVLFATPPGEDHEIGLLVGAITSLANQVHAVYLGPRVPEADLIKLAKDLDACAVVIGSSFVQPVVTRKYLMTLRKGLPRKVRILAGGASAMEINAISGVTVLPTLEQLEQALKALQN